MCFSVNVGDRNTLLYALELYFQSAPEPYPGCRINSKLLFLTSTLHTSGLKFPPEFVFVERTKPQGTAFLLLSIRSPLLKSDWLTPFPGCSLLKRAEPCTRTRTPSQKYPLPLFWTRLPKALFCHPRCSKGHDSSCLFIKAPHSELWGLPAPE